jgi:hypothetical protein
MTKPQIALNAVAAYQTAKVAELPNVTNADKTKVYLATNSLADTVYQASCSAIMLPGSK